MEQTITASEARLQEQEQTLSEAVSSREASQQQLLDLQDQLASGVDGQEQLSAQLKQLRGELEQSANDREEERQQLSADLEQSEANNQTLSERLSEQQSQQQKSDADQQELERTLTASVEGRDQAQQQLLELQDQLSSGADGQEQLLKQLQQSREELELVTGNADAEREKMHESIRLADVRCVDLESNLAEQVEVLAEGKQRIVSLEQALAAAQDDGEALDQQLRPLRDDNAGLQQKVADAEARLLVSTDEQERLQQQIKQLDLAVEQAKASVPAAEKQEALSQSLKEAEQRYLELSTSFDGLSADRESDDRLFKRQLIDWDTRLQASDAEKVALKESLAELKSRQLSVAATPPVIDDERLKQELAELGRSLELAERQCEESLVAAKDALKQKDLSEAALLTANNELADLQQRQTEASKVVESEKGEVSTNARVIELESQLDVATSQLLDLEIQLETASVENSDELLEQDDSELMALKSELGLVREQTEKDVAAMQGKLENSEKMNLALKKKILSMQTIANEQVLVPDDEPKTKKKGWWKK